MRRTVLGSGFVLAAIGLAAAAVASLILAVVMLIIATVGFKVAASSLFVIPQQYLVGALAAPAIALMKYTSHAATRSVDATEPESGPAPPRHPRSFALPPGRRLLVTTTGRQSATAGTGACTSLTRAECRPVGSTAALPAQRDRE